MHASQLMLIDDAIRPTDTPEERDLKMRTKAQKKLLGFSTSQQLQGAQLTLKKWIVNPCVAAVPWDCIWKNLLDEPTDFSMSKAGPSGFYRVLMALANYAKKIGYAHIAEAVLFQMKTLMDMKRKTKLPWDVQYKLIEEWYAQIHRGNGDLHVMPESCYYHLYQVRGNTSVLFFLGLSAFCALRINSCPSTVSDQWNSIILTQ